MTIEQAEQMTQLIERNASLERQGRELRKELARMDRERLARIAADAEPVPAVQEAQK